MRQAGLQMGPDYRRNLGDKFFEFDNGSMIEFKTADNPESLRGAGLDILWMDEAAFIPTKDAWNVSRPALSDKLGLVITTTTPHGKNWFHKEFWSPESLASPRHGRVEYWSIQNPYFDKEEWEEVKASYHPLLFKQEFMAAFDSMAGVELRGDWLQYYTLDQIPRKPDNKGIMDIQTYLGVDPAISLSDDADRFAMILLGVDKKGQGYLLEEFADRIPFPEQVEKVMDWMNKYKPSLIGIESNAYQAALEQQLRTLSGVAPFVPVMSKGKKEQRILRMAPVFRTGAIKVRETHHNFINEWIDYDSTKKNSNDDVLDAMDIALGLAGALLPELPKVKTFDPDRPSGDIEELARRSRPGGDLYGPTTRWDDMFGSEF
jgi:predicted phage terminase large subunit-like protein